MPARHKLTIYLIALMAIFLFNPQKIFAQVVINELLPNPTEGPDWVELYNTTNQDINLNDWILDDEGTKTDMVKIKEATMSAYGFWLFEVGSRLNKSSDTVYLINNQGTIVDEYDYSTNPGDGISFGRMPDGGEWGVCSEITPELENKCILPSSPSDPSPSPSSSPTSSSAPSPSPTPSPKPIEVTGATLLGKILGEEVSPAGFYPWEATEEGKSQEATESSRTKFISKLFLGLGLVFLVSSGVWIWYTQLR
ncbi:lamin tail domain-containing protein [Patescibacteria group bacterium]|nr:lamin tail domain-containing protein [Patescibacteria group bacterium]